jgi:hypothetical protein
MYRVTTRRTQKIREIYCVFGATIGFEVEKFIKSSSVNNNTRYLIVHFCKIVWYETLHTKLYFQFDKKICYETFVKKFYSNSLQAT